MKIALVNLCKTEDFTKFKYYQESIDFLNEENIDYLDFVSGADTIDLMVKKFNDALTSKADLLWFVCGGLTCIQTLDKIDWVKVVSSKKKFYGLSDFTHFSTMAIAKGLTCYYGQGLSRIKQYFPDKKDREFIVKLLRIGVPVLEKAKSLFLSSSDLDVSKEQIVGGHLTIFTFMQNQLKINLADRYLFIEYHNSAIGEGLNEIGYFMDQMLYILKNNFPKGFILGRTELKNIDNSIINIGEINKYLVEKLSRYNLPVFYLDHYKNTVTFR